MDHPNTVLIVDDENDILKGLGRILRLDGYAVETAVSLSEVSARTNWSHIDIILLDRKLADGMAEELLSRFKEVSPQAAVIMITGYADMESSINALREGVEDYLIKPVNPEVLRRTLKRISRLKDAERRAKEAERLATIGQMVAVLAHESGNALARAQASLEMLSMEMEGQSEALKLIARIGKAHRDLRSLFEEVRSFAAPVKLHRSVCALDVIWRQAWNNLTAAGLGKEAAITQEVTASNLDCEVDSFRMEQVYRNLFENALVASAEPVKIIIGVAEGVLNGRPALTITIQDNGPGLSSEQRQKAFQPFYTTKQKGTGLGLAIVQRIIEAHGGKIVLPVDQGSGATFVITLPRVAPNEEQSEKRTK